MIKLICQKANGEKLDITNLLINVLGAEIIKAVQEN